MSSEKLYVVACLSNPLQWQSRYINANRALDNWLSDPNVHVTLVECVYDGHDPHYVDLGPRGRCISVRANTICWNKESLLNIGIKSLPDGAKFVGTFDLDVIFNEPGWGAQTIAALQRAQVVQPWMLCFNLDHDGTAAHKHRSLCSLVNAPDVRPFEPFMGNWIDAHGTKYYGHPGFAWAWRRDFLCQTGGLFDLGVLGSGDRHMSFAMLGYAQESFPPDIKFNPHYRGAVADWAFEAREPTLGYVPCTINHLFHGDRAKRYYQERWHILADCDYDPTTDVFYNSDGVLELTGNKPALTQAISLYFRERDEDGVIQLATTAA